MTLLEFLQQEKPLAILTGVAGAAAMAMTDWRGWWRFFQHLTVGALASGFGTPALWGLIAGWLKMPKDSDPGITYFFVGAFGIYALEVARAAIYQWRKKDV